MMHLEPAVPLVACPADSALVDSTASLVIFGRPEASLSTRGPILTSAIEPLRASLHAALAEASFDMGRTTESNGFTTTNYSGHSDETIEPAMLRDLLEEARWGDEAPSKAKSARLVMPEELGTRLADSLRDLLGTYVDPATDSVGHAMPIGGGRDRATVASRNGLFTHATISSLEELSRELTKQAAVLGVDHVTELLAGWVNGEPLRYHTCRVAPLTLDHALNPAPGVEIVPLPLSSDALQAGLPSGASINAEAYLGQSIVKLESVAEPVLFHPDVDHLSRVVTAELSCDFDFDAIWEVLSLACNAHVSRGLGWNDYGGLFVIPHNEYAAKPSHLRGSLRWTRSVETGVTTLHLDDGAARILSQTEIGDLLSALNTNPRTRLAAARWRKSMSPLADMTDRFIDLRIALEALLLPDGTNQQLSYTVGIRGAWLVGGGPAGRRQTWLTLRSAYATASNLVHGSSVKRKEADVRLLLKEAQELCRRGILRVLDEGQVTDWDGLILDAQEV